MKTGCLVLTAFLIVAGPAAYADTAQLIINANAPINISSPNDNFWGDYIDESNGSVQETLPEAFGNTTVPFVPLSLTLPAGSVITSALVIAFVPQPTIGEYGGTGTLVNETEPFAYPEDPNEPHIPPVFAPGGTSEIQALNENCCEDVAATISGNTAFFDLPGGLMIQYIGSIGAPLEVPGSNYAGWVGGSGQVEIPYVEQLDVTYTPAATPEPSTLALLATALSGLARTGLRRLSRKDR